MEIFPYYIRNPFQYVKDIPECNGMISLMLRIGPYPSLIS